MIAWGVIVGLVVGIAFLAWFAGRSGIRKEVAEDNAKIKAKQLDAALDKPSKSELADKLRSGKL